MIKLKKLLTEQPPQKQKKPQQKSPEGGGGGEQDSQKLKINIPDNPFEPDSDEIIDHLKYALKQWKVKQYSSDVHRWKEYYTDIKKLVDKFDKDNDI